MMLPNDGWFRKWFGKVFLDSYLNDEMACVHLLNLGVSGKKGENNYVSRIRLENRHDYLNAPCMVQINYLNQRITGLFSDPLKLPCLGVQKKKSVRNKASGTNQKTTQKTKQKTSANLFLIDQPPIRKQSAGLENDFCGEGPRRGGVRRANFCQYTPNTQVLLAQPRRFSKRLTVGALHTRGAEVMRFNDAVVPRVISQM